MHILKLQFTRFLFLGCLVFFFGCKAEGMEERAEESDDEIVDSLARSSPNILLIIADDMGLDASPGYNIGAIKPDMPNLQNMINSGITFNNVWAYPTCTPTRASILTGKYGFRTNVTKVGDELAISESSIHNYLDGNSNEAYNHAVIGKWHLSRDSSNPITMGANYYAGIIGGSVQDYTNWNLIENSIETTSTEYTTTKLTDLAIDWVAEQEQSWFLWLSYNAPHTPFHLPPDNLHSQGTLPDDEASITENPIPYYMAALEAMDSEIGRLLSSMSSEEKENTVLIFVGDNGTPNEVRQEYANRRVKGTIYQGGINVPMVVSGALVNRINEHEDALIVTSDFFATIADIAGAGITEINDSKSFKGLFASENAEEREFVYSEIGNDSGGSDYTIRNETHKYIKFDDDSEALYDLNADSFEQVNLLNENLLPLNTLNSIELKKLTDELILIRNQ